MKTSLLYLFLLAVVLTTRLACSCDEIPPVRQEVARSDVVFTGHVVRMSLEVRSDGGVRRDVVVCHFALKDQLKGLRKEEKEVAVVTSFHGSANGFHFELGVSYLVYASVFHGELETSICRRTRELVIISPKPGKEVLSPDDFVRDDSGEREAAEVRALLKNEPNKALEPTPPSVTPRANARVAPAGVVAHL